MVHAQIHLFKQAENDHSLEKRVKEKGNIISLKGAKIIFRLHFHPFLKRQVNWALFVHDTKTRNLTENNFII